MDIKRAFQFFQDDADWLKKLGIGIVLMLLSFLIVPIFMIQGYGVAIGRKVMNGKDTPLPEWDFGTNLKDGFWLFLATIIYTLPVGILMGIGVGMLGAGADGGSGALTTIGGLVSLISLVALLLVMFISPAINVQYIREGNFGAMMKFGEVLGIARSQAKNILLLIGVFLVIGIVFGAVSLIPCVGLIISLVFTPLLTIIGGHLYGQLAQLVGGKGKMSEFDFS